MEDISAGVLQWLEDSTWAATIRQSSWLYPWLEIAHIAGITILVGAAVLFDLRLLGFSKHLPVRGLAVHLLSWSQKGLVLVIPSGILLFITNAVALGHDPVFGIKMGLLFLAGLNAATFHRFSSHLLRSWNENDSLPVRAKLAAIFSIILWVGVIACGRLLAY
ncbi:MAG: DUF6644 family protein [Chitinophagaceae bacterium]